MFPIKPLETMKQIVKLTRQEFKGISPYETGILNQRLEREYTILLNPSEIIYCEESIHGGTKITYKKTLVDIMHVKETLLELSQLINQIR
jgi:hypothetical protein